MMKARAAGPSRLPRPLPWFTLLGLAARVVAQTKQCDPNVPEVAFQEMPLDDDFVGGRGVLAADLNGDGDADLLAVSHTGNLFKWFENKLHPGLNISFTGRDVVNARTAKDAWSAHAADLDGDGDIDLLLSYGLVAADSFVTWYENDDTATFPFADATKERTIREYYKAKEAKMVHGADVDGDGQIDALVAIYGDNAVKLLVELDDGGSSLSTEVKLNDASVQKPQSVFPADVDGDGDVDVLVADEDAGIMLYDNNGDMPVTFTQHLITTSLTDVRYVTAVDLLGDGGAPLHLDLLAASASDWSIAWYENDNSTGSKLPSDISERVLTERYCQTGNNARGATSVQAADLNGDGCLDVLYAGSYSSTCSKSRVNWEMNDCAATPTFVRQETTTLALTAYGVDDEFTVAAHDLDQDGDIDILVTSKDASELNWYMNDCAAAPTRAPTGGFPSPVPSSVPSAVPSSVPTAVPSSVPSSVPTIHPAPVPTPAPTPRPSTRCSAGVAFATETVIEATGTYVSVLVVDLDKDGYDDVLAADAGANAVAWYPGSLAGFGPANMVDAALSFDPTYTTRGAYAIDLDADGDIDILAADFEGGSSSDGALYWYANDGDQTFTNKQLVFDTGASDAAVYALDLDGDGDADVLAASRASNHLYWFRNDDETFERLQVYDGTGGWARAVAVYAIDVDGDMDVDVLSASDSSGRTFDVAWYENDGAANFERKEILGFDRGRRAVVALDVDGDGDVDVLDASYDAGTVSWYESQATDDWGRTAGGQVTFEAHTITPSATGARAVEARDLDGDGDVDVLAASALDDTVAWYENLGRAGYTPSVDFVQHLVSSSRSGFARGGAAAVAAADVNNDGAADIVAGFSANGLAWYGSDCVTAPPTLALHPVPAPTPRPTERCQEVTFQARMVQADYGNHFPRCVFAADLDNDGDVDALVAGHNTDSSSSLNVLNWFELEHEEDGTFHESGGGHELDDALDDATNFDAVYAVDVDSDGDVDVVAASSSAGTVSWYKHNHHQGNGTHFRRRQITTAAPGARAVYAVDLDDDGDVDLLSASCDDDTVSWYENEASAFTKHDITTGATCAAAVHAADLDGDGRIDVVAASAAKVAWYQSDVSCSSTCPISWTEHAIASNGATSVYALDVDGDGAVDVLAGGDEVRWYRNDGQLTFILTVIKAEASDAVFAADVDGDGDADVLVGYADAVTWYENSTVALGFTERVIEAVTGTSVTSLHAVDMDGDGDVDVLAAIEGAATPSHPVTWYVNDCDVWGRPTYEPSAAPVPEPTRLPTSVPTTPPSSEPSGAPTPRPTPAPTPRPTFPQPTPAPIPQPTATPGSPTRSPSHRPTGAPTPKPSPAPSTRPTPAPTTAMPSTARPTSTCDTISLAGAALDDTGATVTFRLTDISDRARYADAAFPCDAVIILADGADNRGESCQFAADDVLVMTLVADASRLQTGTRARLVPHAIKPLYVRDCDILQLDYEVSVAAAGDPVPVVLALPASPLVVSYCTGDLVVDAAASTGGGGRALQFAWDVDFDSTTDATDIILRYPLTNRPEWTDDIDLMYLDPFNVYVQATNWLGSTATRMVRVEPTLLAVPNVYIEAGSERTMFRWQPLKVFAFGFSETCDGASVALEYDWYVVGTPVWSASQDPRAFKLAPYSLDTGSFYEVVVTVTDSRYATNTARTTMYVQQSEVLAVIDGGSKSVASGTTVVLDASRSVDPDGMELTFVWKENGVASGTGATYETEAPLIGATSIYEVHVYTSDGRTASYETTLYGVDAAGPALSIEAPAGRVDCTSTVVVPAFASKAAANYTLAWSATANDIFERALAPTTAKVDANKESDLALVFGATDGLVAGSTYAFRLAARMQGSSSFADVMVQCNAAPTSGLFTASPATGTVYETSFDLFATSWVDLDLPLTYDFYQASVPLTNAASSPSFSTELPAGDPLALYVDVRDAFGASTRAATSVVVLPSARNASFLRNATELRLEEARATTDVQLTFATLNIAAANERLLRNVSQRNATELCERVPVARPTAAPTTETMPTAIPQPTATPGSPTMAPTRNETYTPTNASSFKRCTPLVCGGVMCGAGALEQCIYLDATGRETNDEKEAVTPGRCACKPARYNSSGFGGDACELTMEEGKDLFAYRRRLLDALSEVRRFQGVDMAHVRQQAATLDALAQSTLEPVDARKALDLVAAIAADAVEASLSMDARRLDAPLALVGAMSSLLTALPSSGTVPNVTDELIVDVVDDLAAALAADQIPDQQADVIQSAGLAVSGMRRSAINERVPTLLGDTVPVCSLNVTCAPGWDAGLKPPATFSVEGTGDFAVSLATFAMTPRRNASAPLGARVVRAQVEDVTNATSGRRRLARRRSSSGGGSAADNHDTDARYDPEADGLEAILVFPLTEGRDNLTGSCVWYNFAKGEWTARGCRTINITRLAHSCACPLAAVGGRDFSESAVDYYVDALSEPITFRTLQQNVMLLAFVGTLAGLFALMAIYGYYADKRDAAQALLDDKAVSGSFGGFMSKDAPSEEELVRASLPDFVLGLYNAPRFGLKLVWENHSLTSLYSVYDPMQPRPARALVCLFNVLVIIAAEAMCHWLKYPMGYCRAAETRASCLAKTLLYDEVWVAVVGGETKQACHWNTGFLDAASKPCELDVQESGVVNPRTLFLELVVVLLTLPALKFHNWLFFTYVSAPRKSTKKVAPAGACERSAAARRAVHRLRRNLRLSGEGDDLGGLEAKQVVYRGARDAVVPAMRAMVRRKRELDHALDDHMHEKLDRSTRRALKTIREEFSNKWGVPHTPWKAWTTPDLELFALRAHKRLSANLDLAARVDARIRDADDAGTCGLYYFLLRCDDLTQFELEVIRMEMFGEDGVGPEPVEDGAKTVGTFLWVFALLYPLWLTLQFAQRLDAEGSTGKKMKRAWFYSTVQFICFSFLTIEPMVILITMIVVPLAVRDKLLFLENPRNRHLPFRADAPVDPSALVSYEKVLAFDRLGLPEPRRLKHMRDDSKRAAAHRAHDDEEVKEEIQVKHHVVWSQKVEELEFITHATREMKLWLGTLHKHEDVERKENAKFRAKGGSCTLWRGHALTRVAATIAYHPAWYQFPLSLVGECLLWTPPVPRDTFLEENIIAMVFAIVGIGSSFGGKRMMFEANSLIPGMVVVLVCWFAMVVIIMTLLVLIEVVEKLNAFIIIHKDQLRLKDTALDLEERLHRHEVRERCHALEGLWNDYEEATILEDARGMAPSAADLSSLLAHVEDDPNAAVARENDLFVSAQARIEEHRLGLSRGPMTHEVKSPPRRLKALPHRPKRPPPPMPSVVRTIMMQGRAVRAFQSPGGTMAPLVEKDLSLTDAQKAKFQRFKSPTTSERAAALKARRDEVPCLTAEEQMAEEMAAARREAEALMASFGRDPEEPEAAPAVEEAPARTGPRRLEPAFEEQHRPRRKKKKKRGGH